MRMLNLMLSAFVKSGTLTVIGPDGNRHVWGDDGPAVTIRLNDNATGRKIFWNPNLAAGEAYMDGKLTIEDGDIYDFLDLCFRNIGWGHGHWLQVLLAHWRWATRRLAQFNPASRAQRNVAHHYDLSDELYELFLDSDRQYSCAYFASPDDDIETAQTRKKRHLASKLLIRPGMKVLDIGSGWGGLAMYLAEMTGCEVTGITLSENQHAMSNRRAAERGLSDRVRFELRDYRQETGNYDRIVSVGMFEHVGVGHYGTFFDKVRSLLKPDGVALLHTIGRADGPGSTNPWLAKYIFPGGYTPAMSEVTPAIERAGLYITDLEVLRLHYAETLKAWRRRFNQNREKIRALYDERFCRMWEFYLAGCEAAFRHGGQVVFQIQMTKEIDAVPMTRDYMFEWEREAAADRKGSAAAE